MKPIIGIVYKNTYTSSNHKINYVYEDIFLSIKKSGGIPIGISSKEIVLYLDLCSGFIFQGGDDLGIEDILAIKEIIDKDLPLLGICLGMQELATLYHGTLYDISNHLTNSYHIITIKENTLLYKILNTKEILVNSRHKSAVKETNLTTSSLSKDNVIESIEDPTKKFVLGLQWHPESIYDTNIYSQKIFTYFVNICKQE